MEFQMFNNLKYLILSFIFINSTILYAGCGGCQVNNNVKPEEESSAFVTTIPYSGKIDGFVIASCNKCNFGQYGQRKCSMGIKVNQMVYEVKNYNHDHSKAHNHDGICNALRIAHVSGKIQGYDFVADTFELIDRPTK